MRTRRRVVGRRIAAAAATVALVAGATVFTPLVPIGAEGDPDDFVIQGHMDPDDPGLSGTFESADGNLALDDEGWMDWDGFIEPDETDTAAHEAWEALVEAWNFNLVEDEDAPNGRDTIFGGGVKQDDSCPRISTGGPGNKNDLTNFLLAADTAEVDVGDVDPELEDHDFLYLGWQRVPQNSTTASAHVAFEFNQASRRAQSECGGTSPFFHREAGDMLIVYNFEGGASDVTVHLSRWITGSNDETAADCESAKSLPCWDKLVDLTAEGLGDGAVNRSPEAGTLLGDVGVVEFGEAAVNLTATGVFEHDECITFGWAHAVSRTSGNSGQAQLKDYIPPARVSVSNCATVDIEKVDEQGDGLDGARFTLFHDNEPQDGDVSGLGDFWRDPTHIWPAVPEVTAELTADVDDEETTLAVHETDGFAAGDYIIVNSEIMLIDSVDTLEQLTVVRAQLGTEADEHFDLDTVTLGVWGEDTVTLTGATAILQDDDPLEDDDTEISVDDSTPFAAGDLVLIGDELIDVVSVDGTNDTLTVVRGAVGTTAAVHLKGSEVQLTASCTTAGGGEDETATCSIPNVFFGEYWLVETKVPEGFVEHEPVSVTVEANGDGDAIELTNSRAPETYRMVVIVCSEQDEDLVASLATLYPGEDDEEELVTLDNSGVGNDDDDIDFLCGLDAFETLEAGSHQLTVTIPAPEEEEEE